MEITQLNGEPESESVHPIAKLELHIRDNP